MCARRRFLGRSRWVMVRSRLIVANQQRGRKQGTRVPVPGTRTRTVFLDTRRCCMRLSWLAVPVLIRSLILVACGDDDDSPEELNQAFCDDLDAFGDSLADWTDL